MCQLYYVIENPAAVMIITANVKTTEENNESASSQLRHKLKQFPLKRHENTIYLLIKN